MPATGRVGKQGPNRLWSRVVALFGRNQPLPIALFQLPAIWSPSPD